MAGNNIKQKLEEIKEKLKKLEELEETTKKLEETIIGVKIPFATLKIRK